MTAMAGQRRIRLLTGPGMRQGRFDSLVLTITDATFKHVLPGVQYVWLMISVQEGRGRAAIAPPTIRILPLDFLDLVGARHIE